MVDLLKICIYRSVRYFENIWAFFCVQPALLVLYSVCFRMSGTEQDFILEATEDLAYHIRCPLKCKFLQDDGNERDEWS